MNFELTARRRLALSSALALIVGIATAGALRHERRLAERRTDLVDALVSRKYIAAGKALTADDVVVSRIPKAYLEPGAVSSVRDLGSARARLAIQKGAQVTRSNAELSGATPGLAWVVPPGERVIAFRLPPERAAGGHLLPGDRVDVIAVSRRTGDARVLARRRRIAAAGDRLWDPAQLATPAAATSAGDSVVVALFAPIGEAERLASAAESETIVLALASPLGDLKEAPR